MSLLKKLKTKKDVCSLQVLGDALQNCVQKEEDGGGQVGISFPTDHYLCVCNEYIKLFKQLGKGPSHALNDTGESIKSLEIHRVSSSHAHYDSLDRMLLFEAEKGVSLRTAHHHYESGTTALFHLHHAMEYMLEMLMKLHTSMREETHFSGSDMIHVYQATLGKSQPLLHHATTKMMLVKSAGRHKLLKRFCKSITQKGEPPEQVLHHLVEETELVYVAVRDLLEEYVTHKPGVFY